MNTTRYFKTCKPVSVGEMFKKEKKSLKTLPGYEFETVKCSSVSPFAIVREFTIRDK